MWTAKLDAWVAIAVCCKAEKEDWEVTNRESMQMCTKNWWGLL